jgi:hypothetical protein
MQQREQIVDGLVVDHDGAADQRDVPRAGVDPARDQQCALAPAAARTRIVASHHSHRCDGIRRLGRHRMALGDQLFGAGGATARWHAAAWSSAGTIVKLGTRGA